MAQMVIVGKQLMKSPLCIVFHEWCFQEMNFHFKFAEGEKYKLGSNILSAII